MNIDEQSRKFIQLHSNIITQTELNEFANTIIDVFYKELINNSTSVSWNCGFDSVVFVNKSVDGLKSIKEIKGESNE